ncbi:MAG TPA: thymidine kinase [Bacteroidetes bacterium]|nr:thymidine kinase [Bacteroidota bacterium]HRR08744.1 thymidine kinase [Rhodothermales bacterium]
MEPFVIKREETGWIEVVCGSMFSGKTEELIRRMRRAEIAKQRVEIFKPAFDVRYAEAEVVSHNRTSIPSVVVQHSSEILQNAGIAQVIGIDEAHFFDTDLPRVCQELARKGRRVIIAGLDQDYRAQPFEQMAQLMAIAEYVTKLHAICVVCGAPANNSQRIVASDERLLLGEKDAYEPRCRHCFEWPNES